MDKMLDYGVLNCRNDDPLMAVIMQVYLEFLVYIKITVLLFHRRLRNDCFYVNAKNRCHLCKYKGVERSSFDGHG